jgi:hypothetical protein
MRKLTKKTKVEKIQPKNYGLFCTECDNDLNDFAFSTKAKNKKRIKKNHENCVKTGKFSGEFCSKMFISSDVLLDEIFPDIDQF